jgi:hypothetical protein
VKRGGSEGDQRGIRGRLEEAQRENRREEEEEKNGYNAPAQIYATSRRFEETIVDGGIEVSQHSLRIERVMPANDPSQHCVGCGFSFDVLAA